MDADSIEIVHGFLLHHDGNPKGGYANRPDAMAEQLRKMISDETRRATRAAAESTR